MKKNLSRWLFWFLVGNTVLLWLVGLHYFFAGTPFTAVSLRIGGRILVAIFLVLAYLGHMALLAFALGLILLPLIFLLPKPRFIFTCAVILATCLVVSIFIDTFVYNQYTFHLNGIILQMFFGGAGGEIFDFSWLEYGLTALIILGVLAIEIFYSWWLWRVIQQEKQLPKPRWPLLVTFGSLLISYILISATQRAYIFIPMRDSVRLLPYYNNVVAIFLPNENLIKIQRRGENYILQPDQASAKLKYPLKPLVCQPNAKPLNLLVIVIDTWRFDMLNPKDTPFIAEFSKDATVYNHHFSGGNATRPGIFSLFYGLPATYWTSTLKQDKGPVFIDELLKQHYQMGIYVSAGLKIPAFNRTVFTHVKNLRLDTAGKDPKQRDDRITQEFKQFITQTWQKDQPFFGFLFYDAAHSYCGVPNPQALYPNQPSVVVCNRLRLTNHSNPIPYINRYKNALLMVDHQVEQVITLLKQNNLLDNTVIVITGDHGQEFNDNHLGYWGHASNFTHYQIQTPLMIYWPKLQPSTINYLTSHFDITPTLMKNMLGCQNPPSDYSVGSLLDDPNLRRYLIISSYIDFGIVEPNQITTIYPLGNYEVTDTTGHPKKEGGVNINVMRAAFKDMKRFYQMN